MICRWWLLRAVAFWECIVVTKLPALSETGKSQRTSSEFSKLLFNTAMSAFPQYCSSKLYQTLEYACPSLQMYQKIQKLSHAGCKNLTERRKRSLSSTKMLPFLIAVWKLISCFSGSNCVQSLINFLHPFVFMMHLPSAIRSCRWKMFEGTTSDDDLVSFDLCNFRTKRKRTINQAEFTERKKPRSEQITAAWP